MLSCSKAASRLFWPSALRSSPAPQSGPSGPKPPREDRRWEEQPPRFFTHRHLADLHAAAQVGKRLLDELADRERRHAHGIDRQHEVTAVLVEQPSAVGKKRREIFFEAPEFARRTAS